MGTATYTFTAEELMVVGIKHNYNSWIEESGVTGDVELYHNGILVFNTHTTPEAVGGILTRVGGNTIHTFLSDGVFIPTNPVNCQLLIVGGGAGGTNVSFGSNYGSGGAGGCVGIYNNLTISTPKNITIGLGGLGGADFNTAGGDSVFDDIIIPGGYALSLESTIGGCNRDFLGGNLNYGAWGVGGGGGAGAGGAGSVVHGGIGIYSTINGTNTLYGSGGSSTYVIGMDGQGMGTCYGDGVGTWSGGGYGVDGKGEGGGGTNVLYDENNIGGNGGSGIVIISYPTPY